jgi:hypothetical protein
VIVGDLFLPSSTRKPSPKNMPFHIPSNHPVSVLRNKRTQVVVMVAFGVGFLMGYVAFIVGVFGALHGMRSLIQILCYRRKYLRLLKLHSAYSKNKSSTVQAKVVSRKMAVDPITSHRRCKVVLEYYTNAQEDSHQLTIHSSNLPFASMAVYYDAHHEGSMMELHLIQGKPIPTVLYQDKVDPIIVFIGLYSYLFLAWLYTQIASASAQGSTILVTMSVLSPLFMAPYLILEVRARHERRTDQLANNPIELITEFDKLRNVWQSSGPTLTQKFCPILFAIGILIMAVFCNAGVIPGCWTVWTLAKWTDLKITRQRESLVQSFRQSKRVTGYLVDCHLPGFGQHESNSVTLQYHAPTGEKIEKKLENERLFRNHLKHQQRNANDSISSEKVPIDVMVLSDHPSSGYPETEISQTWSLYKEQIVSVVSLLLYLLWFLIQYDDWLPFYFETNYDLLDSLVNDVCLFWAPAWAGIILMMPQAYSFHRLRYRKFLADVYETGKTIDDNL